MLLGFRILGEVLSKSPIIPIIAGSHRIFSPFNSLPLPASHIPYMRYTSPDSFLKKQLRQNLPNHLKTDHRPHLLTAPRFRSFSPCRCPNPASSSLWHHGHRVPSSRRLRQQKAVETPLIIEAPSRPYPLSAAMPCAGKRGSFAAYSPKLFSQRRCIRRQR